MAILLFLILFFPAFMLLGMDSFHIIKTNDRKALRIKQKKNLAEKEEFNKKIVQAIHERDIETLTHLTNDKLFDSGVIITEGFSLLHNATFPPPLTNTIKNYLHQYYCESTSKEKRETILNDVLNDDKITKTMQLLIEKGVDPNIISPFCAEPLRQRQCTPLGVLLFRSPRWTPKEINYNSISDYDEKVQRFYRELYQKKVKNMVQTLLLLKADPNKKENVIPQLPTSIFYTTILESCVVSIRDPQIMRIFLMHGANFNKKENKNIIIYIARYGRIDICEEIFNLFCTYKDKNNIKAMLLFYKCKEIKWLSRLVLHKILEHRFGEKFILLHKYHTPTLNQLLHAKDNQNQTPFEIAKQCYELWRERQDSDIDYRLGPWTLTSNRALEIFEKLIPILNPEQYK